MKFKLFYKFLILIMLFSLIPMVWLGINLINRAEFSIKTPISELHINRVENIKNNIVVKTLNYEKISNIMDSYFSSTGEWGDREKIISSVINSDSEILSISLLNSDFVEVIKGLKANTKDMAPINREAIAISKKNSKYFYFVKDKMVFIFFKGRYFIKIDVDKNKFFKGIEIESIGEKSSLILSDYKGNIIYLTSSNSFDWWFLIKNSQIANYISNKIDATLEFSFKGKKYLGAVSNIEDFDLSIISLQEESDAYKYAMSIKKEAFAVVMIFSIGVIFLSYFLSKNLSNPIIKFMEASKKIAEKDFSVRVSVSTRDELKDLADSFNLMAQELDKYSKMQIEKILRERQNTQAVMYSTQEGIIMVDLSYNIQLINRQAISIMGCEGVSVEGLNLFKSIKNDIVIDAVKKAIDNKNKQFEFDIDFKNYKRFYRVYINDIKMKDKDEIIGYLITFYDITFDKELEKIKEDFLHSITHDLRNPVSAIKGFAEFLLKEIAGPINQNQKNMIVSIDRAAFRLLGMVNNILDIAKMEAGKMEINITEFNVYELVAKCVDLMSPLAQKKDIKFVIDGDKNIKINADTDLIERLYINLIGNAIKFTPQEGRITIGFVINGTNFRSWVEDTGEGIPPEYIDKVFEKFEQVKGQKAGGTGLGLTISKHISEAHLGKIWAEYRPNMGAKFVFEFPLGLYKDEFGKILHKQN